MKRFPILLIAALALLPAASASAAEEIPAPPYTLGPATRAKALAADPEGALWFVATRYESERVVFGKVTPEGEVTEFKFPVKGTPKAEYLPNGSIVVGPEGDLWFGERRGVGRASTAGELTSFPLPKGSSAPTAMAVGQEGNIWFTEGAASRIGRITPDGKIAEFRLPPDRKPSGIALGPDGNLWFTERGADEIGRIGPSGKIAEFAVPGRGSKLDSIALGPDGNLWFAEAAVPRVGRITPSGEVTQFDLPTGAGTDKIVAGPGERLFFISGPEIGAIGPGGEISWPSCLGASCLVAIEAIAVGPEGTLWAASGVGHCLGLCGGGTGLSFAFEPGRITPYTLPPLQLEIGPRLRRLHDDRTSLLLACGLSAGCEGTLRLGRYYYSDRQRHFETLSRATYDLAAGESKRVALGFTRLGPREGTRTPRVPDRPRRRGRGAAARDAWPGSADSLTTASRAV